MSGTGVRLISLTTTNLISCSLRCFSVLSTTHAPAHSGRVCYRSAAGRNKVVHTLLCTHVLALDGIPRSLMTHTVATVTV